MAKLQQVIRECTKPMEHAPKVAEQSDFSIFVEPINGLDVVGVRHDESETEYPTVTVKVSFSYVIVVTYHMLAIDKHELRSKFGRSTIMFWLV